MLVSWNIFAPGVVVGAAVVEARGVVVGAAVVVARGVVVGAAVVVARGVVVTAEQTGRMSSQVQLLRGTGVWNVACMDHAICVSSKGQFVPGVVVGAVVVVARGVVVGAAVVVARGVVVTTAEAQRVST